MFRSASIMCGITASGLLAWVGYSAVRPPADEPKVGTTENADSLEFGPHERDLVVENAEQELGERPEGGTPVVFRVTNHSDRAAEVVGLTEGCTGGCCFFLTGPSRMSIPSGGTVEIAGELGVPGPGPFAFAGKMYLNDGGQLRVVRLKITGVGVPWGKPHAPPP